MKIFHTADWHLGQTFFGYDRSAEHKAFLDWLCMQIKSHATELLLISGDIFDSPNPSAESQRLFYKFIRKVTNISPELQIIITAGNHDSAARLEAPNPLLENFNVHIRGLVHRTNEGEIEYERLIIPVKKDICCLAVPYLRQGDYPSADSYNEGVNKLYSTLYETASKKYRTVIAMGHLQATGSEISTDDRSERTTIGGLDCIHPETFNAGIAYTALGHLHKAQRVSGRENIRYSGSPLPMSFAERNNRQSITAITLQDNNTIIEKIEFDTPVKLLSIPQTPQPLSSVLQEIEKLPMGTPDADSPFLEIRILVTEPEPALRNKIEQALEGRAVRLARIEAVTRQIDSKLHTPITYDELRKIEPSELADDIYKQKYGEEKMPAKIKELLDEVIKEVENNS